MTEFEQLRSKWSAQSLPESSPDGYKEIIDKVVWVRRKQRITNLVLGLSLLFLGYFVFHISAFKVKMVAFALFMMIGALVIRMTIELISIKNLRRLNITTDMTSFRKKLTTYYVKRKVVHLVLTPILVVLYIVGFIILLPFFKATLSAGFYTYIIVSAMVVFLVLGIIIISQIKKEMAVLKELRSLSQ